MHERLEDWKGFPRNPRVHLVGLAEPAFHLPERATFPGWNQRRIQGKGNNPTNVAVVVIVAGATTVVGFPLATGVKGVGTTLMMLMLIVVVVGGAVDL